MEDFLKDRPIADGATNAPPPAGDKTPDAEPAAPSPFPTLERTPPQALSSTALPEIPDAQTITADAGAKVETVVENGRVTKIVVTCSCGKVTELACSY